MYVAQCKAPEFNFQYQKQFKKRKTKQIVKKKSIWKRRRRKKKIKEEAK